MTSSSVRVLLTVSVNPFPIVRTPPLVVEIATQPDQFSRQFDEAWQKDFAAVGIRKGQPFALKPQVDEAIEGVECVAHVLTVRRTGEPTAMRAGC